MEHRSRKLVMARFLMPSMRITIVFLSSVILSRCQTANII